MAALDPVAESVSLWFRLLSCHARILAELRRDLDDRMTIARFDLLASLNRRDGQTLAALSRDLLVTAGNVTGLVDRAERDGVVARRPDPADRRLARVWLTDPGRALIRDLLPAHAGQVHALLGSLPAAHRRDLRRLLGALRDHLAREGDDAHAARHARHAGPNGVATRQGLRPRLPGRAGARSHTGSEPRPPLCAQRPAAARAHDPAPARAHEPGRAPARPHESSRAPSRATHLPQAPPPRTPRARA